MRRSTFLLFCLLFGVKSLFSQCLVGHFTVGGAGSDFATVQAALNEITTKGWSGNIWLEIAPGQYDERLDFDLNVLPPCSAGDVVVRKNPALAGEVIIAQPVGSVIDNFVLRLRKTYYVTFENMSFVRSVGQTQSAGRRLIDASEGSARFRKCRFVAPALDQTSLLTFGATADLIRFSQFLKLDSCRFEGGSWAVGTSGTSELYVKNCQFEGQAQSGLVLKKILNELEIRQNSIRIGINSDAVAISRDSCFTPTRVVQNWIESTGAGLDVLNDFWVGNSYRFTVAHNFLITPQGLALRFFGQHRLEFLHNSVRSQSGIFVHGPLDSSNPTLPPMAVVANIFDVSDGPSLELYTAEDIAFGLFQTNCFVPRATQAALVRHAISGQVFDFSAWKTGGREVLSLQKSVAFVAPDDLHLAFLDADLNGRVTEWTTFFDEFFDIDGEALEFSGSDVGADQFSLPNFRGDLSTTLAAIVGQPCGEVFEVKIDFRNSGGAPLTSANISWKINGLAQPDYVWSGLLSSFESVSLTLGVLPFLNDSVRQIEAVLTHVNGLQETSTSDNSASFALWPDLAGGDVTVGFGGDFATINDLNERLKKANFCSSTRILFLPGKHVGNLQIEKKHGFGPSKTLEIASASGEKRDVSWQGAANGVLDGTLLLLGTDHVTVRDLQITGPEYLAAAWLVGSKNVRFENCLFFKNTTGMLAASMDLDTGIVFKNCQLFSTATVPVTHSHDIVFEDCEVSMDAFTTQALTLENSTDCRVQHCQITSGVRVQNCQRVAFLNNECFNQELLSFAVSPTFWAFQSDSLTVANNIFSGKNFTSHALVSLINCRKSLFAHNSLRLGGSILGAFRVGFDAVPLPADHLQIRNNIISSEHPDGVAMTVFNDVSNIVSNQNSFWSGGQNVVAFSGTVSPQTLQNWQTTSGQDAASIVFKPPFFQEKNLRIIGNPAELAGKAAFLTPFSEKDIDGDPRSSGSADLGADQFFGLQTDAKIVASNLPDATCHGLPDVFFKLKNEGPDTLRRAQIDWKINGDTTQKARVWRGILAAGETSDWLRLGEHFGWKFNSNDLEIRIAASRDANPANDLFLLQNFKNRMGGAYTVGGPKPDFRTLADAAAMRKAAGACKDVHFLLRPGNYETASFEFDALNQGTAGNEKTIIEPEHSGLLQGEVFQNRMLNLPNMELRRLRLLDASIKDVTHDILYENCDFSGNFVALVPTIERLSFKNCRFQTNLANIGGSGLQLLKAVSFENCAFGTPNGEPSGPVGDLSLAGIDGIKIQNCRFERTASVSTSALRGPIRIEQNFFGSSPALMGFQNYSVAADSSRIANNFFHFKGKSAISNFLGQPLQIEWPYCEDMAFQHNSMFFDASNPAAAKPAAFGLAASKRIRFENNLVKTHGSARAISWDISQNTASDGHVFDHNHFNLGPFGFHDGATSLSNWKTISGFDQNSTAGAVLFEAEKDPTGLSDDLHLAEDSPNLPLTSNILAAISVDFDGQTRGLFSTQIGADEAGVLPLAGAVWPGDCNADKKVTTLDWLHLGLAIGQNLVGPSRADSSISWSPKFAADWPDSVQNVNSKHADSDGDGFILAKDTAAIALNFGDEHFILGLPADRLGVPLFVDLPAGPFQTGQKIAAPIRLGEAAEAFYGLAFEVEFSQNSIKSGSFWADFGQNWLGSDAIGFFEKGQNSSRVSLALTKTNGSDAAGFGQIGTLHFEVGPLADSLKIRVVGTRGILADGSEKAILPAEPPVVEVLLDQKNIEKTAFEIWPNPTDGLLFLKLKNEKAATVELFDALGRLVFSKKADGSEAVLDLKNLPSGFFQLRILTEKGTATRTVLIQI